MKTTEKEFEQISAFIDRHWERAVGLANAESLMTYWAIGAFVSTKLKSAEWGSKVIEELCDYLKTHSPKRRGFSKRQIYNMVEFFEAYSSQDFKDVSERLRLEEFVQLPTAQIVHFQNAQMPSNGGFNRDVRCVNQVLRTSKEGPKRDEIVQLLTAQLDDGLLDLPKMPEFLGLITHPLRGGQEAA